MVLTKPRALLVLAFCVLSTSPVLAQSASESEAARRLGQEGIERYQQGQYPDAVERLERAYRVAGVPTLGLWSARALEKSGRLVEASERYREVLRIALKPGDPEVFAQAQREAGSERDKLQPRIPRVTIEVQGAQPQEVSLTIDGATISNALIGVPVSVNPGTRTIEARARGRLVAQQVGVAEGESVPAVLDFAETSPVAAAEAPAEDTPPAEAGPDHGDGGGSTQRTAGFAALGLGGAGLAFGVVTGVMAMSRQSDLEESCPGGQCEPAFHADVDSFNTMRTLSIVGFGVGVVGVGAGLALLLTAPAEQEMAHVTPWVGLASAGVRGRF
jgi:hypothetical protein